MCYEHVAASLFIYFFEIFVTLLFSPVFVCFIRIVVFVFSHLFGF